MSKLVCGNEAKDIELNHGDIGDEACSSCDRLKGDYGYVQQSLRKSL